VLKHLILSHPCLLNHGITRHPENAGRLAHVLSAIAKSPFSQFLDIENTRLATVKEIALVHDIAYVNHVLSQEGKSFALDPETHLTEGSVVAARMAAGLGIELVERVVNGTIENGFCIVRPPGHHAEPNAGMGFCIFNNIAIGAKKALSMGLKRVMIIDFDVHHGNGTQKAFYGDDSVFFIDFHQDNLFPNPSGQLLETGEGKGLGFTANIPMPDSCRDDDYIYAFETIVEPLITWYAPELILVSAGFDAHENDPLGSMSITTNGFGRLLTKIKHAAEKVCGGKLVLYLEGGYNPQDLAENVLECVNVLVTDTKDLPKTVEPYTYKMKEHLEEVYRVHVSARG
jgi:acetoin utilization deacetylase AcuC-like enzyme